MDLTEKQKDLIERMGVFMERQGMPPTEARISVLLLVADKTELTFDEIMECLMISKSATSNALNMLLKTNKIEYITRSGDRKRYFRAIINWEYDTELHIQGLYATTQILKEVLDQRPANTDDFNKKLKNAVDFLHFLQADLFQSLAKWRALKTP